MIADDPKNAAAAATEDTNAGVAEPPTDATAAEAKAAGQSASDPADEVARLEAEKADLTERLVRLAADMDNLRKRTERDVADAHRYAVTKFASDMLVVNDNLRRALETVPAEKRQSGDESLKALFDGVEMTEREMDRLLERNGVKRIPAMGERFDPHKHQAMFELPDPSVPAGTVVQVVQEGYQIGDRVLRAAMVGVSKGGPPAQESSKEQAKSAE